MIVILFFLLLSLLSTNKTTLACGIWGYVGSDMPNMWKFRILGMYNLSRGRHSCGVAVDGNIMHGIGLEKEFPEFILKNHIPNPVDNSVVLGHTRHATSGAHTEKNAHPFLIGENMVCVHNGTIENIKELVAKYEVDVTGIEVDSQMLYKIIYEKGFDVLSDYVGYAALMFHYIDEPNVLYVYHGASRDKVDGDIWVERPLHYHTEPNGVYFSSEAEHLKLIQSERIDEKGPILPKTLPANQVFRIDYSTGTVDSKIIFKADRVDNNITVKKVYSSYNNNYNSYNQHYSKNENFTRTNSKNNDTGTATSNNSSNASTVYCTPENLTAKDMYVNYFNSRFIVNDRKAHGIFRLTDNGAIKTAQANNYNVMEAKTYYFFKGVMIKDHKMYQDLFRKEKTLKKLENSSKFARIISYYSKYPVMVTPVESTEKELAEKWFWEGKLQAYLSFAPLFTGFEFEIFNSDNSRRKTTNNKGFNTGIKTEVVFTSIERDNEEDESPVDFYDLDALDVHYKDYKEVILNLSDEHIKLLMDYIALVYFVGMREEPTEQMITNEFYRLIDVSCLVADMTLREAIEHPDLTIKDYVDSLDASDLEEDEDEDDEEEEQEKPKDMSTILEQLENQEEEEETPENLFTNAIEEIIVSMETVAGAVSELETLDHPESLELSLLVAANLNKFKEDMLRFLYDKKRLEMLTELKNKLDKVTNATV